jgi:hypothetical protein
MLVLATLGKITVLSLQVLTLNEEGSILLILQEVVPLLVRTIEERWDDVVKDDGVYQAVRCTSIIQEAYLLVVIGHPGREETYRILVTTWY